LATRGDGEVRRGEIWWADLGEPRGSGPAGNRPVLVVQADAFNRSRISTVLAVVVTSNLALGGAPGNVVVRTEESGLDRDAVVNVSQVVTLDRRDLASKAGGLFLDTMREVDAGLRLALDLGA
jgi:mRNA interferase MazF